MESLDSGFLAASSVLAALPASLNRSRSPCPDPELAPPPPAAGACAGGLAALLELTCSKHQYIQFELVLKEHPSN